jgi:hypothetical protein
VGGAPPLAGEPRLQLLIEVVTGRKVRLLDPRDLERPAGSAEALAPAAPRRLGWGFEAKLVLTRDRVDARTVHIEGDDKKFKDPLVLDLGAVSSELSEGTFDFDFDIDAGGCALQTLTAAAGGRGSRSPRSTAPSTCETGATEVYLTESGSLRTMRQLDLATEPATRSGDDVQRAALGLRLAAARHRLVGLGASVAPRRLAIPGVDLL